LFDQRRPDAVAHDGRCAGADETDLRRSGAAVSDASGADRPRPCETAQDSLRGDRRNHALSSDREAGGMYKGDGIVPGADGPGGVSSPWRATRIAIGSLIFV